MKRMLIVLIFLLGCEGKINNEEIIKNILLCRKANLCHDQWANIYGEHEVMCRACISGEKP